MQAACNPVLTTVEDGVLRIVLNRPERRNSLDAEAAKVVRGGGAEVRVSYSGSGTSKWSSRSWNARLTPCSARVLTKLNSPFSNWRLVPKVWMR